MMNRRTERNGAQRGPRSDLFVRALLAFPLALACGSSATRIRDGGADALRTDAGTATDVHSGAGDGNRADGNRADDSGAGATGPWQNLTPNPLPAAWPSARSNMAMAFDTSRQKLMVFGGSGNGTVLDDLWEWDIASGGWTNRTVSPRPAAWPQARFLHAMAYDPQRMKTVLFGGGANGPNLGDTWEWDAGTGTWASGGTASHPWNRTGMSLVYDPSGVIVLFGGSGDEGLSQEIREWDGLAGTWTDRTPSPVPANWPPGRTLHGAAYDSARMKMMIFGGEPLATANQIYDDLWEWDRATETWTSRTPTPRPPVWPEARTYPGVAFAEKAFKLVLYAGLSGPGIGTNSELWSFDGTSAAWVDFTPTPLPATWPPPRVGHAVAYGATTDSVYVFGGDGYSGLQAELWQLHADDL